MNWIVNRQDERKNVFKYFPEVKSIISVGLNYFTGRAERNNKKSGISNYAWGDDYHDILKNKLFQSLKDMKKNINIEKFRICVDTSPVMDKVWAQISGMGWIGKHTNLITRDYGSWVFLGELMVDVELDNLGLRPVRRAKFNIGLTYETDKNKLTNIVKDIQDMIHQHPMTNDDGRVRFMDFGPSSLDIMIIFYVKSTDWDDFIDTKEDINYKIIDIVNKHNSSFAFPSTSVYIEKK